VEYDQINRYYTYEIVETNKGFSRYRATLRVEPDPAGCLIEWSFQSDPVKGWSETAFLSFFEIMTRGLAKKLEEEIISDQ
jgi:Polyketide cyclase / dehydrase and lipid transport